MYENQVADSKIEMEVREDYSGIETHMADTFQKRIAMVDQAGWDLLQEKCLEIGKMEKVVPTVQHVHDQVDEER